MRMYACVYVISTFTPQIKGATWATYIRRYIHTYIDTYIHTYILACVRAYIRTYVHTYMHTYIHTYIRTYIHTHKQTYTHIHTFHIAILVKPSVHPQPAKCGCVPGLKIESTALAIIELRMLA